MAGLRKSGEQRQKSDSAGTHPSSVRQEWEDIFQAIGHPSFILKPNHTIVVCNKAVAVLTGKPMGYFVGRKCYDVFHQKSKPPNACPMEKLIQSGHFETVEMEMEALGRTFLVSCTPLHDESGALNKIIHIATDVTEQKRTQQKLSESEEKFRIILENLPDGVFVHDLDGRVIQVNKAGCTMTGYTEDELTSMTVGDIDEESITRKDREKIWHNLEKGDSFLLINATHRRKDGSQYPAEIRINSIVLNKKPTMLALVQNVTERKRAEQKLHDYQERLKALTAELSFAEERERRRIAMEIHDDLGQKLAMAKFRLQALRAAVSDRNMLAALDNECNMLDDILDDIRSLTFELSNPVLYELGLEPAVKSWLKFEIQKKAGLKCEFTSQGGKIELNEDIKVVLFKAVRELLTNIIKHAEARNAKVGIAKHDTEVVITVEDDGSGFDADKLRLPSGKGGGFGLFNIKERLEYMGGRL